MFTICYLYATLLLLTGVFALIKASSLISFCMSTLFAFLLTIFTYKKKIKALILTNMVLSSVFLIRYLKSFKFVTPGLFGLISIAIAIHFIFQLQRKSASQE